MEIKLNNTPKEVSSEKALITNVSASILITKVLLDENGNESYRTSAEQFSIGQGFGQQANDSLADARKIAEDKVAQALIELWLLKNA